MARLGTVEVKLDELSEVGRKTLILACKMREANYGFNFKAKYAQEKYLSHNTFMNEWDEWINEINEVQRKIKENLNEM